jgi:hypothetical protein
MNLIVKYFLLADVLVLRGHLRLESPSSWVNMVLANRNSHAAVSGNIPPFFWAQRNTKK